MPRVHSTGRAEEMADAAAQGAQAPSSDEEDAEFTSDSEMGDSAAEDSEEESGSGESGAASSSDDDDSMSVHESGESEPSDSTDEDESGDDVATGAVPLDPGDVAYDEFVAAGLEDPAARRQGPRRDAQQLQRDGEALLRYRSR